MAPKDQSPDVPLAPLPPVLEFLRALWRLNHELEVTSAHMARTIGVTAQQRMVLRIVGVTGPIAAGPLSRLLHVHPGTLSTTLGRLERRGLLRRSRGANDARVVVVSSTARGEQLLRTSRGTVERGVEQVLGRVPKARLRATLAMLTELSESLEETRAEGRDTDRAKGTRRAGAPRAGAPRAGAPRADAPRAGAPRPGVTRGDAPPKR
ncbi:MAG TPA: MarR family winged helix-turn-helix transcriptional regulator [Gemmatimonadaceae bacterium]|nr:MarR family winged helix-turn-helix transcriptional regulator [Gemmatimonadaceae bacterium]